MTLLGILGIPKATAAGVDFSLLTGNPCPVSSIDCLSSGPASIITEIEDLINGFGGMKMIFMGLLFAMLVIYAVKMLLGSRDENAVSEARLAYLHALIGSIVVGGAFLIADAFTEAPVTTGELIDPVPFNEVAYNVIVFLKALLATALGVNIVIQAFRLVMSYEEGQNDNARKRLLAGMIGAAIVILADATVAAFYGIDIGIASFQMAGLARFLVTIFGGLAVISLAVGGVMLVISVDDQIRDRAKRVFITGAVALAVVIASYALLSVVLSVPL